MSWNSKLMMLGRKTNPAVFFAFRPRLFNARRRRRRRWRCRWLRPRGFGRPGDERREVGAVFSLLPNWPPIHVHPSIRTSNFSTWPSVVEKRVEFVEETSLFTVWLTEANKRRKSSIICGEFIAYVTIGREFQSPFIISNFKCSSNSVTQTTARSRWR